MIAYRPLSFVLGALIAILGIFMIIPAIVDILFESGEWAVFAFSAIVSTFIGGLMILSNRGVEQTLSKKDIMLLIPLSWFILPFIAAIPLYVSALDISFTDSYFEAVSGLTGTGSTVLSHLDTKPPGLLLWRSLLQWIGGVGIVVMASGVLPITPISGMQILKLAFDPRMEKTLSRTAQMSLVVIFVYVLITILCALFYYIFGMGAFDAVNHAMTTIATGGYSTHDSSLGFFKNSNILIVSTIFMIIACLPFVMLFKFLLGNLKQTFQNIQARWFLMILGAGVTYLTWNNSGRFDSLSQDLIQTVFNTTSLMSGTGFVSDNYDEWRMPAIPILLFLMMLGGSAGSAACGIKMFRLKIFAEAIRTNFRSLIYPNGVFFSYYGKTVITQDVSSTVTTYIAVFFITTFIFTIIFSALGYDLLTAISATVTALSCVGPGMGDVIGPDKIFQLVSIPFKWVFIVAMIVGRLEVFTLLILLMPYFWKE